MRPIDRLVKQITEAVSPKTFHKHSFKHDPQRPGQSRQARKDREARIRLQRYVPQSWTLEAMSDAERQHWQQVEEKNKQ